MTETGSNYIIVAHQSRTSAIGCSTSGCYCCGAGKYSNQDFLADKSIRHLDINFRHNLQLWAMGGPVPF